MKKSRLRLDARLASAAAFVRGGRLADIGTDHGYLPAALLLGERIVDAVAADINEGPLAGARATAERYGISDRMIFHLADGLHGIEKYAPNDIAILGMGGELIASIIDGAPWVRNQDIRLILQPMTKRAELRRFLLDNCFSIIDEAMSESDGRIYQTICAAFSGRREEYSLAELLVGRANIQRRDGLTMRYISSLISVYEKRLTGKTISGADHREEDEVLSVLRPFVEK